MLKEIPVLSSYVSFLTMTYCVKLPLVLDRFAQAERLRTDHC